MAFLCPVRIRRGKKKKAISEEDKLSQSPSIGRITGSASIETLVRVGIEKENGISPDAKMVVLHEFTPCVDDELEVKRGQIVNVLYQENDWVYVISEDSREGFIPHSYCATYGTQLADLALNVKCKKLPRNSVGDSRDAMTDPETDGRNSSRGSNSPHNGAHSDSESYAIHQKQLKNNKPGGRVSHSSSHDSSATDIHPFFKDPAGRFMVLYTFIARDENDVSVERGEFVTVLNREDPDWFWIVRSDGQEGFVPSAFVYPADAIRDHLTTNQGNQGTVSVQNPGLNSANLSQINQLSTQSSGNIHHANNVNIPSSASDDLGRFHGSELVMLYDYKAQAPDDLSVRRGDWIYADLNNQTVDGWLWAYAPKTRKYGFIPKAYARPPAMTSL
ncbi:Uncharacterised protein g655 [Pycnogonum litorale]